VLVALILFLVVLDALACRWLDYNAAHLQPPQPKKSPAEDRAHD
jgi:hypothetical protein